MEELPFYEEGSFFYQGLKLQEDDSYFQFQDFSADYELGEETWLPAQHFYAIPYPGISFYQDDLGCLSKVDFASFWAQFEEDDARGKEGDHEKEYMKLASGTGSGASVQAGIGSVLKGVETQGPPRRGLAKEELTFELVSRHFCMPIKQAARELSVGVTVLKKRCRQLGIPRWPHRKVKSLQTLIDNIQELGKHNAQDDTRSVVESLQWTKKLIEENPEMMLDKRTKELRQLYFKESFRRRRLMASWATAPGER
nr:unnamed protein product [Digitaria exilis]CAB3504577.1 unnamed protein product [Digitaria exilis]